MTKSTLFLTLTALLGSFAFSSAAVAHPLAVPFKVVVVQPAPPPAAKVIYLESPPLPPAKVIYMGSAPPHRVAPARVVYVQPAPPPRRAAPAVVLQPAPRRDSRGIAVRSSQRRNR